MNYLEDNLINQDRARKELVSLFRKTVTSLIKLPQDDLSGYIKMYFNDAESVFSMTVFSKGNQDNRSFEFYTFGDVKKDKEQVSAILAAIKNNDFNSIVTLSGYGIEKKVAA